MVVIRYEGPKGGPGMPEMLTPTSAIMGAGSGKDVAMLTDGRFSGGSHGFIIGHITPEAQDGGPIALDSRRRPHHDRRQRLQVERGPVGPGTGEPSSRLADAGGKGDDAASSASTCA